MGPVPDPIVDPNNPDIFYGAVPPGPPGDVLVFVHGYGATAEWWWGTGVGGEDNVIYDLAYLNGYRTAFVTLKDLAGSGPSTMWVHGARLADQLDIITVHYGVDKVDIVAHSKGGLDSEAAITQYGADQHVHRVFTLGSPHHGTELVDLLLTPELYTFANLIGLINPATETMTTAYVDNEFRPLTDPIQLQQDVEYWRGAGTSSAPLYSGTWFSGIYLNAFGLNDGVVPVNRTQLPIANPLLFRPLNHMILAGGEAAFDAINNVITTGQPATSLHLPIIVGGTEPRTQSSSIVRAGVLVPNIPRIVDLGMIEPGVTEGNFAVMVLNDESTGSLIQPNGVEIPLQGQQLQGGLFFDLLWSLIGVVDSPPPGNWQLKVTSPNFGAFLLLSELVSPLELTVEGLPTKAVMPDQPLTLHVSGSHPSGAVQIDEVRVRVMAVAASGERASDVRETVVSGDTVTLLSGLEPGLHGINIDISGRLATGAPFSRSQAATIWVDTPTP